jgi:hypothetical protein
LTCDELVESDATLLMVTRANATKGRELAPSCFSSRSAQAYEVLKPVKCSTDEMHRNELGAQHGIRSTWRETPPRMATSTKQKAQRQCYSQREGQTGQKIEYSVDCLVSHSCMLYPITEFFWQSDCFFGKAIVSRALQRSIRPEQRPQ